MPKAGLLKALSTGACSTRTRFQSASSSSASSIGIAVSTPWPISAEPQTTVTRLSGVMRSQALGVNAVAAVAAPTRPAASGRAKPIVSAAALPVLRKPRREVCSVCPCQAPFVKVAAASLMAARIWL